jgi:hypothetical protein
VCVVCSGVYMYEDLKKLSNYYIHTLPYLPTYPLPSLAKRSDGAVRVSTVPVFRQYREYRYRYRYSIDKYHNAMLR